MIDIVLKSIVYLNNSGFNKYWPLNHARYERISNFGALYKLYLKWLSEP